MNATQWPKDFVLTQEKKDYAISNGIDSGKLESFWDDFHDWCLSKGAKYKDWDAAFRMRVRKAREWGLFQGVKHERKTEKKVTAGFDNLQRALNILSNMGQDKFESFCRQTHLSDHDRECVLFSYNGGPRKVRELSKSMLKEA